jgi:hypothetical protein
MLLSSAGKRQRPRLAFGHRESGVLLLMSMSGKTRPSSFAATWGGALCLCLVLSYAGEEGRVSRVIETQCERW